MGADGRRNKLVEETYRMRDDIAALAERADQHRALWAERLNATQDEANKA